MCRVKPSVFLFLIFTVLFSVFSSSFVEASAISGYVAKGNDGKYYEYEYEELLDSYTFKILGASAKLFDDFNSKNMAAYNSSKGYFDYEDILDAYTIAILSNKSFNLKNYIESGKAKPVDFQTIIQVTLEDSGKLKYTEIIVDPLYNALEQINTAEKASQVRAVLEKNSGDLGLSLSNYNKLNNYGKNQVASGVLKKKPYEETDVLKNVFDSEVSRVLELLNQTLKKVNDADSMEKLRKALLDSAKILELDTATFEKLSEEFKELLISEVFAKKPFDSISQVTAFFNEKAGSYKLSVGITFTSYNLSLKEMVDKQMSCNPPPQTDLYGGGWQDAKREDVEYYIDPDNFFSSDILDEENSFIIVNVSASTYLRVREKPSTSSNELTRVYKDETYQILDTHNTDSTTWYKIEAREHIGWVHGDYVIVSSKNYTSAMFQFLLLSGNAGTKVTDLGLLLKDRGILNGTEEAFMEGSKNHNVNEVFLVSLALHETGNGRSALANGLEFEDKDNLFPDKDYVIVYNMFGIGAYDSNPNYYGAKRAYKERWFSPEEAIKGGAKFAGGNYINNTTHKQDTLYKMRWNPANPGTHQYASDIGWAFKQVSRIKSLYDQLSTYTLQFDIPKYK